MMALSNVNTTTTSTRCCCWLLLLSSLLLSSEAFQHQQQRKTIPLQIPFHHSVKSPSLFSLYVTMMPKDEQEQQTFLFRSPFPAQPIPLIPLETSEEQEQLVVSDDVLQAELSGGSTTTKNNSNNNFLDQLLSTYWGPRITLVLIAIVYATNFPLGAIMAQNLPASAATSARMVLASVALAPFLPNIKPHLRIPAMLCGCGTALGYITQSLALVDTDPSKVSFLGAATVLWCPLLEWAVERKPMGVQDAPQTWLAALLCLLGVGVLEGVLTPGASISFQTGDALAILQAIGFGTGCFLSSRMVQNEPDQVLPITSVLIATTAFWSMLWSVWDGWCFQPEASTYSLPNLLFAPGMETVALAVVWTGIISTSLNFFIEISALGRVPPSEAAVLLASEPLWAALLAATVFHQSDFGMQDYMGGTCILLACLANAVLKPTDFHWIFGQKNKQ